MKLVKYKVTSMFGGNSIGDEVTVWLIAADQDTGKALLYSPGDENCSASLWFAQPNDEEIYISTQEDDYINLIDGDAKIFDKFVAIGPILQESK